MKKVLSSVLIVLTIISCFVFSGSAATDVYYYDADGKMTKYALIEQEETDKIGNNESYTYSFDKQGRIVKAQRYQLAMPDHESQYNEAFKYDQEGRVVKYVSADVDDEVEKTYTYKYNSEGNLTSETMVTEDPDEEKTIKSVTSYSYDKENRIKEIKTPKQKTVYSYDSNGNLTKKVTKKIKTGKTTATYKYKYDSNGRRLKETATFISDGETLKSEKKFSYYPNGQIKKVTFTGEYGYRGYYQYDENGNLTKKRTVDPEDYIDTVVNTYTNSKLTKSVEKNYEGEELLGKKTTVYTYNGKSLLTKKTVSAYGTTNVYTYTYDSQNNLTKITAPSGDKETFKYKKLSGYTFKASENIIVTGIDNIYNGKEKKPNVFISGMKNGVDFKVSYENNRDPGKAKVIITFTDGSPSVTIAFSIKLQAVKNLKATKINKTSVSLAWSKVNGAEKYIVYKYKTATKKYYKVKTVKGTKATVSSLKSGTTYKFAVVAVKGSVGSPVSALVTVKTK